MAIDSVNSFGGNAGCDQVWREAPASPVAQYDGPARTARFPHREIQAGIAIEIGDMKPRG